VCGNGAEIAHEALLVVIHALGSAVPFVADVRRYTGCPASPVASYDNSRYRIKDIFVNFRINAIIVDEPACQYLERICQITNPFVKGLIAG